METLAQLGYLSVANVTTGAIEMNPTSVERIVNPRSVALTVMIEIAKNLAMTVPAIRNLRTRMGRTILAPEKEQLDRYVFQLFDAVRNFYGSVKGKSILEIGPGDNLVTGLAFMAAGAKSYTAIDRFPGPYSSNAARTWYQLLADHWPYGSWPEALNPKVFPDYPNVFTRALAVESANDIGQYDLVCSYHVGEHVSDIASFAKLTRSALVPDGVGLHVVDFGGHQWNRFGDPFLFMKFPEVIWNLMGSARGECNRVRFKEYREFFESAGLRTEVPFRRECAIDQRDEWVKARATESFRTTDATFILKR